MEIGEIIKERGALFDEICKDRSVEIATVIYQEVCKDDRQQKIFNKNGKMKNPDEPATEKQVNLMIKLKIPSGKYTKAEASALIEEALNPKKRSE